jgi:hypothetical protein
METLGLGRWLDLYQKADLPNLLSKTQDIPLEIFDLRALSEIVSIRNKCTHDGYVATSLEAETVAKFTEKFLLGAKLVPAIPSPYRPFLGNLVKRDTRIPELATRCA